MVFIDFSKKFIDMFKGNENLSRWGHLKEYQSYKKWNINMTTKKKILVFRKMHIPMYLKNKIEMILVK